MAQRNPLLYIKKNNNDRRIYSMVETIASKLRNLNAVKKAKSPAFIGCVGKIKILVTVDEGAELNCIDYVVAKKAKIKFSNTSQEATAAGSNNIEIMGQTDEDLIVTAHFDKREISLNLGNHSLSGKSGEKIGANS